MLIEGYERATRAFTEAFLAKHSVPGGQQQGLEDAERSTGKCGVVLSPHWHVIFFKPAVGTLYVVPADEFLGICPNAFWIC